MQDKEILLTPGPTHVPERIFQAMNKPTLHHRTETFKEYLLEARSGIKWLNRTESDPVFIAGSGTAAMEAALLNICKKGEQIVVLNAGKFGERWSDIARKLSINFFELKSECGEIPDLKELEEYLERNRYIKAICLQYCETSTTVELPVKEICSLVRRINEKIITIVDAVSAIGTTEIYTDKMQIDILVSAAHKGLMLPPGLALLSINSRAWDIIGKNNPPSLYFDLNQERKAMDKSTTAWTPAMNHIVALTEAIKMIREEGEENVYKRHQQLALLAREKFQSLGLKLMTVKYPSSAVSGVYLPEGIDAEKVRKDIYKKYRIRLAGGQDELQGKVIRFGHMGFCSKEDLESGLSALEESLK